MSLGLAPNPSSSVVPSSTSTATPSTSPASSADATDSDAVSKDLTEEERSPPVNAEEGKKAKESGQPTVNQSFGKAKANPLCTGQLGIESLLSGKGPFSALQSMMKGGILGDLSIGGNYMAQPLSEGVTNPVVKRELKRVYEVAQALRAELTSGRKSFTADELQTKQDITFDQADIDTFFRLGDQYSTFDAYDQIEVNQARDFLCTLFLVDNYDLHQKIAEAFDAPLYGRQPLVSEASLIDLFYRLTEFHTFPIVIPFSTSNLRLQDTNEEIEISLTKTTWDKVNEYVYKMGQRGVDSDLARKFLWTLALLAIEKRSDELEAISTEIDYTSLVDIIDQPLSLIEKEDLINIIDVENPNDKIEQIYKQYRHLYDRGVTESGAVVIDRTYQYQTTIAHNPKLIMSQLDLYEPDFFARQAYVFFQIIVDVGDEYINEQEDALDSDEMMVEKMIDRYLKGLELIDDPVDDQYYEDYDGDTEEKQPKQTNALGNSMPGGTGGGMNMNPLKSIGPGLAKNLLGKKIHNTGMNQNVYRTPYANAASTSRGAYSSASRSTSTFTQGAMPSTGTTTSAAGTVEQQEEFYRHVRKLYGGEETPGGTRNFENDFGPTVLKAIGFKGNDLREAYRSGIITKAKLEYTKQTVDISKKKEVIQAGNALINALTDLEQKFEKCGNYAKALNKNQNRTLIDRNHPSNDPEQVACRRKINFKLIAKGITPCDYSKVKPPIEANTTACEALESMIVEPAPKVAPQPSDKGVNQSTPGARTPTQKPLPSWSQL